MTEVPSPTAAWPAGESAYVALRLLPGADLRAGIERAFCQSGATAGFVGAAVGSLTVATLRLADRDTATRVEGPLEIVALSGTLSPDGPHLHLAVADGTGGVTGGHLLEGSVVRTTAEIVLATTTSVQFARKVDPATGYAELAFSPA